MKPALRECHAIFEFMVKFDHDRSVARAVLAYRHNQYVIIMQLVNTTFVYIALWVIACMRAFQVLIICLIACICNIC